MVCDAPGSSTDEVEEPSRSFLPEEREESLILLSFGFIVRGS